MPTHIITTDVFQPVGAGYAFAGASDFLWVPQGRFVASYDGIGIVSAHPVSRVQVDGHVFGTGFGIRLGAGFYNAVAVGPTGTVSSSGNVTSAAIFVGEVGTAGHVVINHGAVTAPSSVGVMLIGAASALTNTCTISGGTAGALVAGASGGPEPTVWNSGSILAGSYASATVEPTIAAVYYSGLLLAGDGARLYNEGTIAATAPMGAGVSIGYAPYGGAGSVAENQGTITSLLFWGVDMAGITSGGGTLVNHGLVSGGTGAVRGSAGADRIENHGTLRGTIDAGAGNDRVLNTGQSLGEVLLGTGNDLYDGRLGTVLGAVYGGSNPDTLRGGAADEMFFGGGHNDTLYGGAGDDALDGGSANDRLFGGAGGDILTGGAGADLFVWQQPSDRGTGRGTQDVVTDFTPGEDKLDFTDELMPRMEFIGADLFSGTQNEVRYDARGRVEVDVNADGVADMVILLLGAPALTAADVLTVT